MTHEQRAAVERLREQQAGVAERSAPWMVAEQRMDICRAEPESAELILQDLEVEAMSIVEAEKKIKAYADGHKTGSFACVAPAEAEDILRKFYGLRARGEDVEPQVTPTEPARPGKILDLMDFLG